MKQLFILGIVVLELLACSGAKKAPKSNMFDFPSYFKQEVAKLNAANPEVDKVVVEDNEPTEADTGAVDWKKELQFFNVLDFNKPGIAEKYEVYVDSNQSLSIVRYAAKDTSAFIREVSVTRKNDEIQLIEAFTQTKSWVVDRDTRLSYQPGKGYGLLIHENYIWSKPRVREIFAEIKSTEYLSH